MRKTSNRTSAKGYWLLLGFFIVAIIANYHPRYLKVRWNDFSMLPFKVSNSLEIASDRPWLKRRSLSLVCSDNDIRMVLRGRLDYPRGNETLRGMDSIKTKPIETKATIIISDFDHEIFPKALWIEAEEVDTIVTEPLTLEQAKLFADGLDAKQQHPNKIGFFVSETGNYFNHHSESREILAFTNSCFEKRGTYR